MSTLPQLDIRIRSDFRPQQFLIQSEGSDILSTSNLDEFLADKKYSGLILNSNEHNISEVLDFNDEAFCNRIELLEIFSPIDEIPEQIKNLVQLKQLIVHRGIKKISPSIGELKKLEALKLLECSQLFLLPLEIADITNLKHLAINGLRYYDYFSSQIHKFRNLERLELLDYQPYISEEIVNLQKLTALNILTPKPWIFDIPNLEVLKCDAYDHEINGIGKLKSLQELFLTVHGKKINPEIGHLRSLKHLILTSHSITEDFPDLSTLTNLESITLSLFPGLEQIPEFIYLLPKLWYLRVNMNNLMRIPEKINDLASLKYLVLETSILDKIELPTFRDDLVVLLLGPYIDSPIYQLSQNEDGN